MRLFSLTALSLASVMALTACQSLSQSVSKSQAVQATAPSTANAQNGVYDTTLANGLRIIVKQDSRSPMAVTQIWYKVGSNDEPVGKGGLSHFLEHLMFKDSKGLSGAEYTRLINHLGGKNNAFTSHNYTAYYEVFGANQYPVAIQIESIRMKNVIFDPKEIATEKQVIIEERRERTEDRPSGKIREAFYYKLFPDSPMGLPIIGSMKDIEGLNVDDLQQWYNTYYTPNNATLVVVGDVKPSEVKMWAEKYFGDIQPTPVPTPKPLTQKSHRGYYKFEDKANIKEPQLRMGFNVPSLTSAVGSQDAYALSLFSDIADGGLSARLEKELIRKQALLTSVGVYYDMTDRGDTAFYVSATPKAGVSLDKAEQAILATLQAISTDPIDDSELVRANTTLLSGLVFGNDDPENQATNLGMLATIGLPIDTLEKMPQALSKVSKADIQAVGKKYIVKDNLTTMYIYPNDNN